MYGAVPMRWNDCVHDHYSSAGKGYNAWLLRTGLRKTPILPWFDGGQIERTRGIREQCDGVYQLLYAIHITNSGVVHGIEELIQVRHAGRCLSLTLKFGIVLSSVLAPGQWKTTYSRCWDVNNLNEGINDIGARKIMATVELVLRQRAKPEHILIYLSSNLQPHILATMWNTNKKTLNDTPCMW